MSSVVQFSVRVSQTVKNFATDICSISEIRFSCLSDIAVFVYEEMCIRDSNSTVRTVTRYYVNVNRTD